MNKSPFAAVKLILIFILHIDQLYALTPYEKEILTWSQTQTEIFNLIQQRYYKPLEPKDIKSAMIKSFNGFTHLDPHSGILDQEACKSLQEKTSGEFCGIGIALPGDKETDDEFLPVIEIIPGGPADKENIKMGDKIMQIDNNSIRGMTIEEAMAKLRGERNTQVKIKIMREKHTEPLEFNITRDIIKDETALSFFFPEHNVYYLLLSIFSEKSAQNVETLIKKAIKKSCNGIILDLRNNSGGLFDSALDIAGIFIPKNSTVAITKTQNNHITETWKTKRKPLTIPTNIPIFILVNNYTASASEILAGTLQIYSKKISKNYPMVFIVGTKTFGKGSVQEVIPLSNGCAIKLTTSLYYLQYDTCIQGEGIEPDIIIEPHTPPSDTLMWIINSYGRESSLKDSIKTDTQKKESLPEKQTTKKKQDEKPWHERRKDIIAKDYQVQNTLQLINLTKLIKEALKINSRQDVLINLKKYYSVGSTITIDSI